VSIAKTDSSELCKYFRTLLADISNFLDSKVQDRDLAQNLRSLSFVPSIHQSGETSLPPSPATPQVSSPSSTSSLTFDMTFQPSHNQSYTSSSSTLPCPLSSSSVARYSHRTIASGPLSPNSNRSPTPKSSSNSQPSDISHRTYHSTAFISDSSPIPLNTNSLASLSTSFDSIYAPSQLNPNSLTVSSGESHSPLSQSAHSSPSSLPSSRSHRDRNPTESQSYSQNFSPSAQRKRY